MEIPLILCFLRTNVNVLRRIFVFKIYAGSTYSLSCIYRAKAEMDSHIIKAEKWDELCAGLDKQNLLLSPFCGEISCEENIKKDSAR